jgi:hypothetical protein
LQLQNSILFLTDNFPIDIRDEKDLTIQDILLDKTIFLQEKEEASS